MIISVCVGLVSICVYVCVVCLCVYYVDALRGINKVYIIKIKINAAI